MLLAGKSAGHGTLALDAVKGVPVGLRHLSPPCIFFQLHARKGENSWFKKTKGRDLAWSGWGSVEFPKLHAGFCHRSGEATCLTLCCPLARFKYSTVCVWKEKLILLQ